MSAPIFQCPECGRRLPDEPIARHVHESAHRRAKEKR